MMFLKDKESHLNLSFSINVEGYNYMVFATSESMKCFGCGAGLHQICSCLEQCGVQLAQPAVAAAAGGAAAPAAMVANAVVFIVI